MPEHLTWFAAAIVGEQTFWILPVAFAAVLAAAVYRLIGGQNKFVLSAGVASAIIALFAAGLTMQTYSIARNLGCALSLTTYVFGAKVSCQTDKFHAVVFAKPAGQELQTDDYEAHVPARAKPCPCVIIVHGGGWRHGHRSEYRDFDCWLSAQGYVVFDIDYRLANKKDCLFPAQLEDVTNAIDWVHEHASVYGGDPDCIALMGRSAGAHLALMSAYTQELSAVRCVVSYYAPTDLNWDYYHPGRPDVISTRETLENFLGRPPAGDHDRLYLSASPVEYVSTKCPPTLIFQGGHDQVVRTENAEFLKAKLQATGVPVQFVYLPFANHGFDWNQSSWHSQISRATLLNFFKKYLSSA